MSLKMECHLKWNVPQNELSPKMECDSKWSVTQNGMWLKMECHSKWKVTQNGMSLKMECNSKWNVTQNEMSHPLTKPVVLVITVENSLIVTLLHFVNLSYQGISKIDGVAPLIADPPPANSTTMHSRLVCQDRNLCLGSTAYLPCLEKSSLLSNQ